ncbi:HPP family protein [uncultured Thioclava sp.]|uniref:HPP family protein n=1 Tax=uncultured Thioclava sp. TaxID=473858 RepID=UPI0025DD71EE|nr:HPP family protein [uncultured Thioclava sp.]
MPLPVLSQEIRRQIRRFGPSMGRRPGIDILRGAIGAGLAIFLVTFVVDTLPHSRQAGIYLVSSFASTAVLLFVLPNSPLAQPWASMMGMLISAVVPILVLQMIPPPYADGLAVAAAIATMMAARALHPPAAGIALLVVLEHEAGRHLGLEFAIFPIATLTGVLIVFAMIYNRLFGISYPTRPLSSTSDQNMRTRGPARTLSQRDLADLLVEFNHSANLAPADLARLMAAAEHRAAEALLAGTRVRDIMTHNPVTVTPEAPLSEIVRKMTTLNVHTLPVVDSLGYYLGLVDQHDALDELFKEFDLLRRPFRFRAAPPEAEARAIFHTEVQTVEGDTPVGTLLERLARREARVVPVTEAGHLKGILTRTDIMTLLLKHSPAAPHDDAIGDAAAIDTVPSEPNVAPPQAPEPERRQTEI